jgi:hypothetical protein
MSLTSSIVYALSEPDGSKHVHEQHVDQEGMVYSRFYLAGAADDINANLAAYAAELLARLADEEVEELTR